MMNKLVVSPSPHINSGETTQKLMFGVIIALVPALAVSVVVYGLNALVLTGVSVLSCMAFEWMITRWMLKSASTLSNLSAVVTGMLLAFNLPINLPIWMVVLGALVAIGVGKMSFGGLGQNPFNPALVARVFLLLSFPVAMTTFPAPEGLDALSGATPLAEVKEAIKNGADASTLMKSFSFKDMLMGFKSGSFGEIGALALLLGLAYMLIRKIITWHIPVAVLGSMAAFAAMLWAVDPTKYVTPEFHLLTGGALLGAIFMATDYVTSPMTRKGMIIYGVGIGLLTIIIRVWGAYPEGMSFAILIMNAFVPLINKYVKPHRFGGK